MWSQHVYPCLDKSDGIVIYVCMCVYVYVYVCMYVYVYVCMYVCLYVCVCAYIP